MRAQQGQPDHLARRLGQRIADGDEVAERLRHLLALHGEYAVVHPVAGEGRTGAGAFALRDLVLVMGEDQIHAAAVDVQRLAKIGAAHGRAFDVPAGAAASPSTFPPRQGLVARLPQHEIGRIALVGGDLDARARDHLVVVAAGKRAVAGRRRHVEQHVPLRLVGVAGFDQRLDERDHLAARAPSPAARHRAAARRARRYPRGRPWWSAR